jgi:AI-2 transport protein TqsA
VEARSDVTDDAATPDVQRRASEPAMIDRIPGRPMSMLVGAAAAAILIYVTGWLAPVLAPLGLGLFVAALAAPLFTRLVARGASAPVALTLTIGIVLVVGAALILLAAVSIRSLSDGLATYASEIEARYAAAGLDPISRTLRDVIPLEAVIDGLRAVLVTLVDVAIDLGFAVVVAALLLLDARRLVGLVTAGAGAGNPVFRQVPSVGAAAVTYFLVRIRVNLVTAVALFVLMVVLGVDDALLWAVGTFFLSFVPYVGLVIALIPPTVLAFAESGLSAALVLVIGGTILNVAAENVLEPALTGRALKLSTWFVFVMFFLMVWLIGPIGALLAMPVSVLLVLVLRTSDRASWAAHLLARDVAPPLGE